MVQACYQFFNAQLLPCKLDEYPKEDEGLESEPDAVPGLLAMGNRGLTSLSDREVAWYTISCKNSTNIDLVIDWLVKHSKSKS